MEEIKIKLGTADIDRIRDSLLELKATSEDLEKGILSYFLEANLIDISLFKSLNLTSKSEKQEDVVNILKSFKVETKVEYLIDMFEVLLSIERLEASGVVFTPKYISDFIVRGTIDIESYKKDLKIIDPACGCGIFLISAIEYISENTDNSVYDIVKNNIYGIDIIKENVRRTKYAIEYYLLINNISYENVDFNIKCKDSLKNDLGKVFSINRFEYVIGNPPYLNTHELTREEINYLKSNYETTQKGSFNIFYAFIEKSLDSISEEGRVSFIIPNNWLTIKSAKELREFLKSKNYIEEIIDFKDNMIFSPVRTYNTICKFNKAKNETFNYSVVRKSNKIEKELLNLKFYNMSIDKLDNHRWVISDEKTLKNISNIESQEISLKELIRTGIATLKDEVFLVEKGDDGYIKKHNNKVYNIDSDSVVDLYKISDIKGDKIPSEIKRYIIFPYFYDHEKGKYTFIEEVDFKEKFKSTYDYLLDRKNDLSKRDKGKPNNVGWYAYGRSQGFNNFGSKLLFPTFSDRPKFTFVDEKEALICNGYSVLESKRLPLDIVQKILNSEVMDYYIRNTSYMIEGGYYCYQKKYIEKFTIPNLLDTDIEKIRNFTAEELDKWLIDKYCLSI